MLECKDIRPLLPEYAAGTLAEETARQVADHLLLCPICAAALEQRRAAEYRAPMAQPVMGLPRTTPPEPTKKASEAKEEPAPQTSPEPAEVPAAEEAAPTEKQSRLSRRGKVLLMLVALLMVLGTVVALLISRDVFSIRDRVLSADESWTAVMYRGAEKGTEDGFRIRLWTKGDWERETVFHGMEYQKMVWSPDGRFLALELLDQAGKSTVYVMDTQYQREGNIAALLETYLSQTEGYFGNSFLTDVPACTILQWLPDSSALLVAGEGAVDTDVDPDYGIQFAGSTASSDQWIEFTPGQWDSTYILVSNNTASPEIPTVSGYFSYLPETGAIQNIIGFGTPAYDEEAHLDSLQEIAKQFGNTTMMTTGMNEVYYQTDALVELAKLPRDCQIQGVTYRPAVTHNLNFLYESWDRLRSQLTADSSVILFTDASRSAAYVIVMP